MDFQSNILELHLDNPADAPAPAACAAPATAQGHSFRKAVFVLLVGMGFLAMKRNPETPLN